ncbi:MAG: response regulator transcription factor [Chloroflexaceae bacterium]|jgi:DNA-binding NarL/FixJ family response regulator|nr:response regulator transcription factor [Chloroflexaceae bacterium]
MTNIRVLVVDDQQLMRDGIASLLSLQDDIAVVGTAANGHEALAQAAVLAPDVVLMDIRMPGMDGVTATAALRRELPGCRVLMLTTFDDDEYIVAALRAGASGYLLKDLPAADLAQAIIAVQRGIYQLDPTVAQKVVEAMHAAPPALPAPLSAMPSSELSEREVDVVRLIARGATNREIAAALIISEGTVKNHISNILSRLGLRDRTQVALYARDRGIV